MIACDTTEALLRRLDNKALTLVLAEAIDEVPAGLARFQPELLGPGRLLFHYRTSQSPVNEILGAVAASGLTVADMSTEETDLEDIFLQLTRGAHHAENGGN